MLQKQFQLMYNPTSLEEERLSWRSVIYYNITRPVRRILEALDSYSEVEEDDSESIMEGPDGTSSSRPKQPLYEVSPGPDEPEGSNSQGDSQDTQTPSGRPSSLSSDQGLQPTRQHRSSSDTPLTPTTAGAAQDSSRSSSKQHARKGSLNAATIEESIVDQRPAHSKSSTVS